MVLRLLVAGPDLLCGEEARYEQAGDGPVTLMLGLAWH